MAYSEASQQLKTDDQGKLVIPANADLPLEQLDQRYTIDIKRVSSMVGLQLEPDMVVSSTNETSRSVFTLPYPCPVNKIIEVQGVGKGLWRLAQQAGQTIRMGGMSTTTGTGGYIESLSPDDNIRLRCTVANTDFTILSQRTVLRFA